LLITNQKKTKRRKDMQTLTKDFRYPIGTKFLHYAKKHNKEHTITDHLITYNSKGEVVRKEYLCSQEFMGQILSGVVPEATIARSKIIRE
jgi:hypothetical protein